MNTEKNDMERHIKRLESCNEEYRHKVTEYFFVVQGYRKCVDELSTRVDENHIHIDQLRDLRDELEKKNRLLIDACKQYSLICDGEADVCKESIAIARELMERTRK